MESPANSVRELFPIKGKMARRVSCSVDNLERANPITILEESVHLARHVRPKAECEAQLQMIDAQRAPRPNRHPLRLALAGNDVGFPLMSPNLCPAQGLQCRQAAQMRAVGMGEHNVFQVGDGTPHLLDHLADESTVRVVKRIDEGETVLFLDEKGVHVPAFLLTETENSVADRADGVFGVQIVLHLGNPALMLHFAFKHNSCGADSFQRL